MDSTLDLASITRALEMAGCVAAGEEVEELVRRAHDDDELERMLARRLTGEPHAWITGSARFCGSDVAIEPGVYVPRWQSEALALMAARLLPPNQPRPRARGADHRLAAIGELRLDAVDEGTGAENRQVLV